MTGQTGHKTGHSSKVETGHSVKRDCRQAARDLLDSTLGPNASRLHSDPFRIALLSNSTIFEVWSKPHARHRRVISVDRATGRAIYLVFG